MVVDATSGESGNTQRDSRMHKTVLESAKFPEVSFAPDRVEGKLEAAGTSNVRLHGVFKIHGAAHEITVPVQVTARPDQLATTLKFDVPYVAWGMKDPSVVFLRCGKSVAIEVQATSQPLPPLVMKLCVCRLRTRPPYDGPRRTIVFCGPSGGEAAITLRGDHISSRLPRSHL